MRISFKKLSAVASLVAINGLLFALNATPASADEYTGMCVVNVASNSCICSSHTLILDCNEDSECRALPWCHPV